MAVLYDNIGYNREILLDLPFREGIGVVTHDVAKPHHVMTMEDPGGGSFVWTSLDNGLMVMEFVTIGGGATDGVHLNSIAANTGDLNFTSGDYSIAGWTKWGAGTNQSEIIIGRYGTNLDGWDCYYNAVSSSLSHRHHHSSLAPNFNSSCFSAGWVPGVWKFFSISRLGASLYPLHYRNAVPLAMSYEATGMLDPDTCNRDLVVGCRNSKDANWYTGLMWRPRVWGRALSQEEWSQIFQHERGWFGV